MKDSEGGVDNLRGFEKATGEQDDLETEGKYGAMGAIVLDL